MTRVIKQLNVLKGSLRAITGGRRLFVADFSGQVVIREEAKSIPVLGRQTTGLKKIYASLVLCKNLQYGSSDSDNLIQTGNAFEATVTLDRESQAETFEFSGMSFVDSDPIEGTITFELCDLALIQELLKSR